MEAAVPSPTVTGQATPAIDQLVQRFFDRLQIDDAGGALAALGSTSILMNAKQDQLAIGAAQVNAAQQLYGLIARHELLSQNDVGTLVQQRTYLVQHRNFVTRWKLTFIKATTGWALANFNFDDQAQTWP